MNARYFPFGFDPMGRVVSESRWSAKASGSRGYQRAYAYDPGGNRIRVWADGVQTTANFGDMGEITSFGTDTFTTDHFGNMKTQMVGLNTTTFNWDFESHLTGIDYPGTSNDDTHEYDGNGLRMRSKLSGAADWTNFVWDEVAGNLVAEYTLISTTFTLKSVNGWGAGLLWTNREGTKRYFHFDGSGSTWALTDASQNVTDPYEYTSFGVSIASSGSSVNPFRWMGASGAYDDGARGSAQALQFLAGQPWSPLLGLSLRSASQDRGAEIQRRIICFCAARRSGRLKVDCSCKGMGLWLRTENDGRWIGAKCDRIYDVDGFLLGGRLNKIEDGVCVDLVCENGRVEILSCVNWLAKWLGGAKHPYLVEIGRWGPPPSLVGPPVQGP